MDVTKKLKKTIDLLSQGETEKAEDILKAILKDFPRNPDALSMLGSIFIYKKNFIEGIAYIEKSLSINSKQPQAILNCGIAFYQTNQWSIALDYFNKLLQFNKNDRHALFHKALTFSKLKKIAEARDIYKQLIETNPNDYDSIVNLAYIYLDLQQHEEAFNYFEKAHSINPNQLDILKLLSQIAINTKAYERALFYLNKSLGIKFDEENLLNLGFVLLEVGESEKALNAFNFLIKSDYKNSTVYNNRANVFNVLQKYDEAILDAKQAILLDENFVEAHISLGNAFKGLGLYEKSLEVFNYAIKLDPSYYKSFHSRGLLFYSQKKYIESIDDFNLALKIQNTHEIYCDRGCAYKLLEDFDNALDDFNRALHLKSDFAPAYFNRALLEFTKKSYTKAEEDFITALKFSPNNDEIKENYGIFLLTLKNFNIGWSYFEGRLRDYRKPIDKYGKYYPFWKGEANAGNILIHGEHGIGDEVLYASLFNELLNIKGNNYIVVVDYRLISLFSRSFSGIKFISTKDTNLNEYLDQAKIDFFVYSASLGQILRNKITDFVNQKKSFLKSNQISKNKIESKLKIKKGKFCGFAWKSKNEKVERYKSLNSNDLSLIFKGKEFNLVNLQYGEVNEELNTLDKTMNVKIERFEEIDHFYDLDSLCSLIDSCDFIVTSSNVTAHLAGALGKQTFLLLPFSDGRVWYWHDNDLVSLWYPTIKIYRQSARGDWSTPIAQLNSDLKNIYG